MGGCECARGRHERPRTPSFVQSRDPTAPVTWRLLTNRLGGGAAPGPTMPPPESPPIPHIHPFLLGATPSLIGITQLLPQSVPWIQKDLCKKASLSMSLPLGEGPRSLPEPSRPSLIGHPRFLQSSEGTSLAFPSSPTPCQAAPTFLPCLRHSSSWAFALGSPRREKARASAYMSPLWEATATNSSMTHLSHEHTGQAPLPDGLQTQ